MKQQGTFGRLATLKSLAQRFAFLLLVLASFALMLIGKADTLIAEHIRLSVGDAVAPILDVMSRPSAAIAHLISEIRELAQLRDENMRLMAENARLMHWQTVARQLDNENRALQAQLNFIPGPDSSFVTTRVIADTGSAFVHSMLINSGSHQGLRRGQAVVSGEFLVGRLIEVGHQSSRVLLLTDINSHVPVMLESSRIKAILTGDNSDRPRLSYLATGVVPSVGDRVVTSGHGGVFPPGLPVGVVSSVADGIVRVELFVQRNQLDYVTVVDYGLPGILPSDPGGSEER